MLHVTIALITNHYALINQKRQFCSSKAPNSMIKSASFDNQRRQFSPSNFSDKEGSAEMESVLLVFCRTFGACLGE